MTTPTVFKSFVSEKDIEELKKKKQEEWEKVRKPDQPLERPEEVHDSRTLYERLKEQKDKKQEEWDEQFKFKNMIYKGLDDEEAGFLAFVVKQQAEQKRLVDRREKEEVFAFREAVSKLKDEEDFSMTRAQLSPSDLADSVSTANPLTSSAPSPKPPKSQLAMIAGSIKTKRKRNSSDSVSEVGTTSPEKKARRISLPLSSHPYDAGGEEEGGGRGKGDGQEKCVREEEGQQQQTSECGNVKPVSSKIGALSGLTAYSSSDSSDNES